MTVGLVLNPRAHRQSCENNSSQRDHSSSPGSREGVEERERQRVDTTPQREKKQLFIFIFQLSAIMVKCE